MAILSDSLYNTIRSAEGGYQNQRTDSGNKNRCGEWAGTNFGITPNAWSDYTGIKCPTENDMRSIREDQVRGFMDWYGKRYRIWDVSDQAFAELLYNAVYGSGSNGIKVLQQTLNARGHSLAVDGSNGSKTLGALNAETKRDPVGMYNTYRADYVAYLVGLNNPTYAQGWINRMNRYFPVMGKTGEVAPISPADVYVETWKARGKGIFVSIQDFLAITALLAAMAIIFFSIFKMVNNASKSFR